MADNAPFLTLDSRVTLAKVPDQGDSAIYLPSYLVRTEMLLYYSFMTVFFKFLLRCGSGVKKTSKPTRNSSHIPFQWRLHFNRRSLIFPLLHPDSDIAVLLFRRAVIIRSWWLVDLGSSVVFSQRSALYCLLLLRILSLLLHALIMVAACNRR